MKKCHQEIIHVLPDENYLDFRRSVIDDGGGILVTPAIQDLTVDLEEKSCHVLSPHRSLPLSHPSPHSSVSFCHLLLSPPPPPLKRSSASVFIIVVTRLLIPRFQPGTDHPSNGNLSDKSAVHVLNTLYLFMPPTHNPLLSLCYSQFCLSRAPTLFWPLKSLNPPNLLSLTVPIHYPPYLQQLVSQPYPPV